MIPTKFTLYFLNILQIYMITTHGAPAPVVAHPCDVTAVTGSPITSSPRALRQQEEGVGQG
jgi:hypothetical protein